jgi:hypothetical protein
MPEPHDLCTCGHRRDEHAEIDDAGGCPMLVCLDDTDAVECRCGDFTHDPHISQRSGSGEADPSAVDNDVTVVDTGDGHGTGQRRPCAGPAMPPHLDEHTPNAADMEQAFLDGYARGQHEALTGRLAAFLMAAEIFTAAIVKASPEGAPSQGEREDAGPGSVDVASAPGPALTTTGQPGTGAGDDDEPGPTPPVADRAPAPAVTDWDNEPADSARCQLALLFDDAFASSCADQDYRSVGLVCVDVLLDIANWRVLADVLIAGGFFFGYRLLPAEGE